MKYKFKMVADHQLWAEDENGFSEIVAVLPEGCVVNGVAFGALVEQANEDKSDASAEVLNKIRAELDELKETIDSAYSEADTARERAESAGSHADDAMDYIGSCTGLVEGIENKIKSMED